MARVVSSTVTISDPQVDGRFWVVETQTFDDQTPPEIYQYLADVGLDVQAVANERGAAIDAELNPPQDGN